MFGKKKIHPESTVEAPVEKPRTTEPYDDEPAAWTEMPSEQLLEVWYHLADKTVAEPQPDEMDPTLWYLEAAHTGNTAAQYALGKYYYREGNIFQAGMWYSKASAQGNPFAEYELAKLCEYGIGMEVNKQEAHERYQKAYNALAAKASKAPNKAITLKLTVMGDHHLADVPEDEALKWHEQLQNRKRVSQVEEPVVEPAESPSQPRQENFIQPVPKTVAYLSAVEKPSRKNSSTQRWSTVEDVPIDYILPAEDNPYAENDTEEDLYALAMSIKANGLINPITLTKISESEYRIISGERRYHAITRFLHWETVRSTVYHDLSAKAAQLMLHSANLEVRDYSPVQKLQFYIETEQLLREMQESGEYSGGIQKGIAETLGISTHQVRKYKRIIENLPQEQLAKVVNGEMSIERAYKIALVPPAPVIVDIPDDELDAGKDTAGRTSTLDDKPDAEENATGCTSALAEESNAEKDPAGRTSALTQEPDAEKNTTGRTSALAEESNAEKDPARRTSALAEESNAEKDPAGRTSALTQEPDAEKNTTGRTSALAEESNAEKDPAGRTSALTQEPDAEENATGRTSAFREPENYAETLSLLQKLPVEPGQLCAVISDDKVDSGTIDRIEIYQNTILISVLINSLRRPFPVSVLDKIIFVGTGCFVRAEAALQNN